MASSPLRIGDLEINQDLDVQRRTWIVQRIGWAGMAFTTLAALAGLFGNGPLAHTVMMDDRQLFNLVYDRFGRNERELVIQLELMPVATKTRYVTLWIDQTYGSQHAVEHLAPEPLASRTGPDGIVYTFEVSPLNTPALITLRLRPKSIGIVVGHIRLNDQGSIRFHQLIFP